MSGIRLWDTYTINYPLEYELFCCLWVAHNMINGGWIDLFCAIPRPLTDYISRLLKCRSNRPTNTPEDENQFLKPIYTNDNMSLTKNVYIYICLWICSRGLPLQIANGVFFLQVLICSNYVPCKKPGSPVRNRKIGSPWITDQVVPKSLCSNSNMFVEVTSLIITVYLLLVHLVLVAGKIHLKIWRDRWMDWIFKRRQKPSMM